MQSLPLPPWARLMTALALWPVEWARALLQRQSQARRSSLALLREPSSTQALDAACCIGALQASGMAAPFDIARAQYAAGVQAGLIERSLLASSAFERRLGRLERLALGPWARSV